MEGAGDGDWEGAGIGVKVQELEQCERVVFRVATKISYSNRESSAWSSEKSSRNRSGICTAQNSTVAMQCQLKE